MTPLVAPFRFSDNPKYDTSEVFYAQVGEYYFADHLLNALFHLLWIPGYFGFNWDALDEVLRDLSWIAKRKVVLVHSVLPELEDWELRTYVSVLADAVADWSASPDHEFEVVFRQCDRERIDSIFASLREAQ